MFKTQGFGILETGAPNGLSSSNRNILLLLILTEILQTAPISTLQLPEAFSCPCPVLFHAYKVCLIIKTVSTINWQPKASSLKDMKTAVRDDTGTTTSLLVRLRFQKAKSSEPLFSSYCQQLEKGSGCNGLLHLRFQPNPKDSITCFLPLGCLQYCTSTGFLSCSTAVPSWPLYYWLLCGLQEPYSGSTLASPINEDTEMLSQHTVLLSPVLLSLHCPFLISSHCFWPSVRSPLLAKFPCLEDINKMNMFFSSLSLIGTLFWQPIQKMAVRSGKHQGLPQR